MHALLTLLAHFTFVAYAKNPIVRYCEELHPGCGAGSGFIVQLANRTVDILSSVIGAAAVLVFIWGSLRILTSGGNEEGKTQGKNIIIAALVGVFLALMGKVFVLFVADFVSSNV